MIAAASRGRRDLLIATDTDAAGMKAAVTDYWRLAAAGLTAHRLVLDPGIKDPAEQYQTNPDRLRAALDLGDVGPTLASLTISHTLASQEHRRHDHNLQLTLALAREAGRIIAASPARVWDAEIDTAVAYLHAEAGDDWARDTISDAVLAHAMNWEPHDLATVLDADHPEETQRNHAAASIDRLRHLLQERQTQDRSPAADAYAPTLQDRLNAMRARLAQSPRPPRPTPAPRAPAPPTPPPPDLERGRGPHC